MKYLVIIECSETGYAAYAPDLPGCVAAGESREQVVSLMREAIEFHIEGLRETGVPVPPPSAASEFVEVMAA